MIYIKRFWIAFIVSLLTILVAGTLVATTEAHADIYFVDLDPVMELNCTNPDSRVDGTVLLLSEIREIRWEIYKDSQIHVVTMPGGCYPMEFDLSVLSPGRWDKVATTIDTEGRQSAIERGLPFEYVLFVANPGAPTIIEPGD